MFFHKFLEVFELNFDERARKQHNLRDLEVHLHSVDNDIIELHNYLEQTNSKNQGSTEEVEVEIEKLQKQKQDYLHLEAELTQAIEVYNYHFSLPLIVFMSSKEN